MTHVQVTEGIILKVRSLLGFVLHSFLDFRALTSRQLLCVNKIPALEYTIGFCDGSSAS